MSISRIKTWVDDEILTATDLNAEIQQISDNALATATQAEVNAMTSTTVGLTPNLNKLILATQQASTSGATIDFSSIPAGTRRITIHWVGVSTSGTSNIVVQIGDSGGVETSGYLGSCTSIAGATPATANFTASWGITNGHAAADILHGQTILTLENASAFTWTCSSITSLSNATTVNIGSGSKSLSAELTSVRLTTAGGAETFDAGVVNITYER